MNRSIKLHHQNSIMYPSGFDNVNPAVATF